MLLAPRMRDAPVARRTVIGARRWAKGSHKAPADGIRAMKLRSGLDSVRREGYSFYAIYGSP